MGWKVADPNDDISEEVSSSSDEETGKGRGDDPEMAGHEPVRSSSPEEAAPLLNRDGPEQTP